jgi:hypothetical protein
MKSEHEYSSIDELVQRASAPLPVVDNERTRAAFKKAREDLMTPCGPELIADLLEGIGKHVAELEAERQTACHTDNSTKPNENC